MCKVRLVCNCFVLNKLEINVLVVGFLFSIVGFMVIVPAIIADKELSSLCLCWITPPKWPLSLHVPTCMCLPFPYENIEMALNFVSRWKPQVFFA